MCCCCCCRLPDAMRINICVRNHVSYYYHKLFIWDSNADYRWFAAVHPNQLIMMMMMIIAIILFMHIIFILWTFLSDIEWNACDNRRQNGIPNLWTFLYVLCIRWLLNGRDEEREQQNATLFRFMRLFTSWGWRYVCFLFCGARSVICCTVVTREIVQYDDGYNVSNIRTRKQHIYFVVN